MINVDYFIQNFVMADLHRIERDHFILEYHSLKYPVYQKENQILICNAIKKAGFFVRVGLVHKYKHRQGLQVVAFECSKTMQFNHLFTGSVDGEIEFGVNTPSKQSD